MKTIKLNLELTLPDDALVREVSALLSAWRYILRGIFPKAEITTAMPLGKPKTK